ncbi:MAG: carboxypeptidase-like regulatory domain-containing protein [Ignavibacteriales bacterium]|nr:carboxypeptidase-like regulatory domain-containing protein [Ignavibacteriales bacterium]
MAEPIYSQRTGSIRGFVEDSTTNEVLSYCNIFIEELNIGTSTNDRGYFFIPSLPAYKKYSIKISYIGYDSKNITVNVYENQITAVDIQLSPSVIQLQSVEKIGEKYKLNTSDISLEKIFLRDLEKFHKVWRMICLDLCSTCQGLVLPEMFRRHIM